MGSDGGQSPSLGVREDDLLLMGIEGGRYLMGTWENDLLLGIDGEQSLGKDRGRVIPSWGLKGSDPLVVTEDG